MFRDSDGGDQSGDGAALGSGIYAILKGILRGGLRGKISRVETERVPAWRRQRDDGFPRLGEGALL